MDFFIYRNYIGVYMATSKYSEVSVMIQKIIDKIYMFLNRITLKTAAGRLGYADSRSAESWCDLKGIKVYVDNRKKFIYDSDLDRVLKLDFIDGLKASYPDNYREVYDAIQAEDDIKMFDLVQSAPDMVSSSSYQPLGDSASDFFNDMNI